MKFTLFLFLSLFLLLSFKNGNSGEVLIEVTGINFSKKGNLVIGLFNQNGFPKANQSSYGKTIPITSSTMTVKFTSIQLGEYAVAVFQDQDLNDKLSTNLVGIPNEPFGFSNNKFGMFGPPSFSEVSFKVSEAKKSNLSITIKGYSL